jgi:hypothetical protein
MPVEGLQNALMGHRMVGPTAQGAQTSIYSITSHSGELGTHPIALSRVMLPTAMAYFGRENVMHFFVGFWWGSHGGSYQ